MKKALVLSLALLLFSVDVISQKVTYKGLVGTTWVSKTGLTTLTYVFTDSSHLIQSVSAPQFKLEEKSTVKYSLDTSVTPTLIHLIGIRDESIIENAYFFIKLFDNNTLKMQGNFDGNKPIKWNDNETAKNTSTMLRADNL